MVGREGNVLYRQVAGEIYFQGEINTYFKNRMIELMNYKPLKDTISDKENIKAVAIICRCMLCLKLLITLAGKSSLVCPRPVLQTDLSSSKTANIYRRK